jgi:hypothetical protein
MSTDTNWLDGLLEGVKSIFVNGVAYPKRAGINLLAAGATAVDNPTNNSTDVTLAAGGSGAGSTAVGPGGFGMPAVWTPAAQTVLTIPLLSTAGLVQGSSLTLPAVGVLIVASVIDATHVSILNPGGPAGTQATPGTGVAAGTVVAVGGAGVSLAPQARADGQVLQRFKGADTPAGLAPVYNALASGLVDDAETDNALIVQNDVDGLDGRLVYHIPAKGPSGLGVYRFSQPVMFSQRTKSNFGLTIQGSQHLLAYTPGSGNTIITNNAIPTDLNKTYIGPIFAATAQKDPPYYQDPTTGIWFFTYVTGDSLAPSCGVNLQETGCGNINGLTAFDFSLFFNPLSGPAIGQRSAIAHSYGSVVNGGAPNFPAAHAFGLDVINISGTLYLQVTYKTTGSVTPFSFNCTNVALPANQLSYIEVSYDSSESTPTWRVYIGTPGATSALAGSSTTTGAIVQEWYEDFTIGWQGAEWPMSGAIELALAGQLFGSIRLCKKQINKTTYTTPATSQAMVSTGSSGQTLWLQNFDVANRSVTRTATVNNSLGHEGYIVGLSNFTEEMGPFLPIAGVNVWQTFHGAGQLGGLIKYLTFEHMMIASNGTGIYFESSQFGLVRKCTFVAHRAVTAFSYSYGTVVQYCLLGGGGQANLSHTSHQWLFGALSEQCRMEGCQGSGNGWCLVGKDFDLYAKDNYFDNGVLGCVYAVNCYQVTFDHCYWYNEFDAMAVGLVLLSNVKNFKAVGCSIGAYVAPTLPLIQISGINGAPQRGNSVFNCDIEATLYDSLAMFSSLGTYVADPLVFTGMSTSIDPATDPGTQTDQWVDPVGVLPILIPRLEASSWTFDLTGLTTFTIPGNDFFFGTWRFINMANDVTVTIPYNMRGRRRIIQNPGAAHSLIFTGPGGEALNVGAGAVCVIQCTETYKGTTVALSGHANVSASTSVTFDTAHTLPAGQSMTFASQPGVVYRLASAMAASTSGTLTAAYSGTPNASTTAGLIYGAWELSA